MTVPTDPALPSFPLLLDPEAMAPLLERSLGRPALVGPVRVVRVAYKPGERVTVHYEACVDGRAENAVARAISGRDLEARLRDPALRKLAHRIDGRSPAAAPLVYEPAVRALVSWLPFDPRLPALAQLEGRLLSYKPGRRAVLRRGSRVLKAYGSTAEFDAAARALHAGAALPGLASPAVGELRPSLRLTTQGAVDGRPVDALEAAAEAGALLRRLRGAETSLPAAPPERPLETAARKAALIAAVVPSLASRAAALVRRLERSLPASARRAPAHGDFHSGQLLLAEGRLVLVDLDGLCLGDPALDLAEYAAAAVEGGTTMVETVLAALLEGYGRRPHGLEWQLATAALIRASHPFHRQLPGWPEEIERVVATVESFAAAAERRR